MALAISAACAMACSGPQFTPESVADADHQQVTRVEPLSWWTGMKTFRRQGKERRFRDLAEG